MIKNIYFKNTKIILLFLATAFKIFSANGQWVTQTVDLKPGWNAVYLHVDSSYTEISNLENLNPDINEIWRWEPAISEAQFIQNPDAPISKKTRWKNWTKNQGNGSSLQNLIGNAAYLIKYGEQNNSGDWIPSKEYKWKIKGIPIPPQHTWTSTGLNFLGFSSVNENPPSIYEYFPQSIINNLEFHGYSGGLLSESNPQIINAKRTTALRRGEAFWVNSDQQFVDYYSPFELVLQTYDGINFGEKNGQYRIILRNNRKEGIVVSLNQKQSEPPPNGGKFFNSGIDVIVRGELDPSDLTYPYTSLLDGDVKFALKPQGEPGSSREIILGLNRTVLSGNPGKVFGSILEFTDSLDHALIQVPVKAIKASNVGLWVGDVMVNQVGDRLSILEDNEEFPEASDIIEEGELESFFERDGKYDLVPNEFPLRFIFHQQNEPEIEKVLKLYQRVYHGLRKGAELSNEIILSSDEESLESSKLASARRISSTHLPWSKKNESWKCVGEIRPKSEINVSVSLSHSDQSSNPFLHTYHPDHDNLDARFENELVRGIESYGVTRNMNFKFNDPPDNFHGLTVSHRRLSGSYSEIITISGLGSEKKQYYSRGNFTLNRLSTYPEIHTINSSK